MELSPENRRDREKVNEAAGRAASESARARPSAEHVVEDVG
jgi:hypothetical protein